MPQLIPDIDDYFEERKRDLYLIKIKDKKTEAMLIKWFKNSLPQILIGRMFPFKKSSGMLFSPAIGYFAEFDEESLQIFCKQWEDSHGYSTNKSFQCYYYSLPNKHKR